MIAAYKDKSIKAIIVYLIIFVITLLYVLANLRRARFMSVDPTFRLLGFSAFVVSLYGWYALAKAKGYSGWLTLLVFLQIFGLIILVLLPDKAKGGQISA